MTQFEKLDLLLRECGGTIQTSQVINNGISNSALGKGFICRSLDEARKYSSKNNNGKVLYY